MRNKLSSMDQKKLAAIAIPLFVASLMLIAVFVAASYDFSMAKESTGQFAAAAGPKLWTEKEAPAYVPVQRDVATWRSVRLPPAASVEEMLLDQGKISLDSTAAEREAAISEWYKKASKDAYIGPDPLAYRNLIEREEALLEGSEASAQDAGDEALPTPQKSLLGVVVEFAPPGGMDVFTRTYPIDPTGVVTGCEVITETFGALSVGDDPPPGPRDNFNFYKAAGFTTADYESAFFETGPDAGYGVVREDLGGIDLSGYTLNNYLLEMSRGVYSTTGGILTIPVTVPHSHEYYGHAIYGEDVDGNCTSPTFSDANYGEYILDILDAIVAQYGDSVDWSQYDADGDQIIDLLVTIHAGYAFQNGGGEDRLSTSSSSLFPGQVQIGGLSTPGDTTDDYYVQGFNVDPEQLDVGAIQEEFEHQFGLPDLYVTDAANSNAWWGAHSSGVWGGPLGGTRPVGHNLWQDWVLGWRDPMIIDYNDPMLLNGSLSVNIGRARYTPEGTEDGVIVRMPDEGVEIPNEAGTGTGWWSNSGDLMDNRVYRGFDLITATVPVTFSFDAYWDIEEDWDYGFVEVSTDGGMTWTTLPDIDGVLTNTDPNDNNLGWGLTGTGSGTLRFDLSAYTGMTMTLRLRYLTDPAVSNPGWWVDNLALADANGVLYANDLETDFSDWTNEGWVVTPLNQINKRYYLVEWRDDNGFDQSLNDPYYPVYDTPVEPPPEFEVDRIPATTPGMILSYRNTGQGFDYALLDSLSDAPSVGPKYGLIVIDSHFEAVRFDTTFSSFQDGWVGYTMYGRTKSGNATFGLVDTNEWTARLGLNVDTGEYMTTPLETKTWPAMPPVPAFHDSYGYYPGYYYPGGSFVYLHDNDSSATHATKGPYTTRITDPDGNLLEALYGVPIGPAGLGTGNPGDDLVHYGLHIEVVDSSDQQGTVQLWTDPYAVEMSIETDLSYVVTDTGTVTMSVAENIGGRLDNPYIVVELPANVEYVPGSNFGGIVPVEGGAFSSPAEVLDHVRAAGFENLQSQAAAAQTVRYLVWSGGQIGTMMGTPPFGFDVMPTGAITTPPGFAVSLYKDGTDLFQSDVLAPMLQGTRLTLPVIFH